MHISSFSQEEPQLLKVPPLSLQSALIVIKSLLGLYIIFFLVSLFTKVGGVATDAACFLVKTTTAVREVRISNIKPNPNK